MTMERGLAIDQPAWAAAYEDAFPPVFRGLVALGATREDAHDALHDAFVIAAERRLAPEGFTNLRGWLFVVAQRRWRRRRRRDWLASRLGLRPQSETPPDERVALYSELERLPNRQRQVLIARFVLDLSQQQTAEVLGIARGTVAATTSQAAATLRRRLGDKR